MYYISKRRLYRTGPLHAPLLLYDGLFVMLSPADIDVDSANIKYGKSEEKLLY